jgi:hypothetical protein
LIQFLQCSAYLNFQVNLATEKQANNKSFQIKSHSKRGKNYSITDSKQINIQICKWNSKWKILVNRSGYFGGLTTETWKDLGWWSHLWSNQIQYSHFEVFFPLFLETYMQNRCDNSCWKAKNLIRSIYYNNNFLF